MRPCEPCHIASAIRQSLIHIHDFPRFKRVGPNAMRGRGIGTARGRATIMRGMIPSLQSIFFLGSNILTYIPLVHFSFVDLFLPSSQW